MSLLLAYTHYDELRTRCEISATATRYDPAYEDRSVLPVGGWEPLSRDIADRFVPIDDTPDSILVELVRLPHGADLTTSASLPNGLVTLPFLPGNSPVQHRGRVTAAPGELTTTVNQANGRRIGLHLDNWDHLSWPHRHRSRRRLCINTGPGSRYLILADVDAIEITRAIHPDYADRCPHTGDVRSYVSSGRPLRCFRFRLEPGEGYIAPTEFLAHDGSTEDAAESSTAVFWLGDWPRGILPSVI
jgi:hypothetical protein